jgi:hypothetical protein
MGTCTMSFDGPMFNKPAVPQVSDIHDEHFSVFDNPNMSFKSGMTDAFKYIKESYSRDTTVAGAALAVGMVLSGRNNNWENEADAYANV